MLKTLKISVTNEQLKEFMQGLKIDSNEIKYEMAELK